MFDPKLLNPNQPLLLSDIRRDVSHIIGRYTLHWRHVTKSPVVRSTAMENRGLKRSVSVVRGLIYRVQERRAFV